jgi:hypothetical protein
MYHECVLDNLGARTVYRELGSNAVLLCYERPDEFCHRHIVAAWLEKELGIEVEEYADINNDQLTFF